MSFQGDIYLKWHGGDGGDIIKNAGDYERNNDFENMINILLGTKPKTWNNLLRKNPAHKIIGLDVEFGDSITLNDLRIIESKAERALSPFIELDIAEDVQVEALNPEADKIVLNIFINEKYGKTSKYSLLWGNFQQKQADVSGVSGKYLSNINNQMFVLGQPVNVLGAPVVIT